MRWMDDELTWYEMYDQLGQEGISYKNQCSDHVEILRIEQYGE